MDVVSIEYGLDGFEIYLHGSRVRSMLLNKETRANMFVIGNLDSRGFFRTKKFEIWEPGKIHHTHMGISTTSTVEQACKNAIFAYCKEHGMRAIPRRY